MQNSTNITSTTPYWLLKNAGTSVRHTRRKEFTCAPSDLGAMSRSVRLLHKLREGNNSDPHVLVKPLCAPLVN